MGSMFARVRLNDKHELRGSGSDLESFFNQLAQHPTGLSRSAFGREVSIEEAQRFGFTFREASRMVVSVCGMGGRNSTAFAQALHLQVLQTGGIDIS